MQPTLNLFTHFAFTRVRNALQLISSWMIADKLTRNSCKTKFLPSGFRKHSAFSDQFSALCFLLLLNMCCVCRVIGTARIICDRVYVTVRCPSVCSFVYPSYRSLQQCASGLLLSAPRARDINRLLHGASADGAAAFRSTSVTAAGDQRQIRAVSHLQRRRKVKTDLLYYTLVGGVAQW